jgi:hypothetical protein
MSVKTIKVVTAVDGSFTWELPFKGTVRAVEVDTGDLSTPDIAITDGIYGTSVYTATGLASDAVAAMEVKVMGTLKVAVTGGGDTKSGRINLLVAT